MKATRLSTFHLMHILGLIMLSACSEGKSDGPAQAGPDLQNPDRTALHHVNIIQPMRGRCELNCMLSVSGSDTLTRVAYQFSIDQGEAPQIIELGSAITPPSFSINISRAVPSAGWLIAKGYIDDQQVAISRMRLLIGDQMALLAGEESGPTGGMMTMGGVEVGGEEGGMQAGEEAGIQAGEEGGEAGGVQAGGAQAGEEGGMVADEEGGMMAGEVPGGGSPSVMNPHSHGAWLWYIEGTGMTHTELASRLARVGFKRVYIKVADGGSSCQSWPELCDTSIPQVYRSAGLEPWAWSYNYPGNVSAQAEAIATAETTGYAGYVLDIEVEFDGLTTELESIMSAFSQQRSPGFPMYVTTWGNPDDHGMRVDIIDRYVDGHMPQTYLEVWGQPYMDRASYWTEVGTCEYRALGAMKPVHHIVSAEYDVIDGETLRTVFSTSGPEASLWRVPGEGTPLSIWDTIEDLLLTPIEYSDEPTCVP